MATGPDTTTSVLCIARLCVTTPSACRIKLSYQSLIDALETDTQNNFLALQNVIVGTPGGGPNSRVERAGDIICILTSRVSMAVQT